MRIRTLLPILALLLVACPKKGDDTSKDTTKDTTKGKDKKKKGGDDDDKAEKVDVGLPKAVKFDDAKPIQLSGKKVKASVCKLDKRGADMKDKDFSGAIGGIVEASDGTLYVIDNDHKVRHYRVQSTSPCELALDTKFGDNGVLALDSSKDKAKNYFALAVDKGGTIYASGWETPKTISPKGKTKDVCDNSGTLVIDPSTNDGYLGRTHGKIDGGDCKLDDKETKFSDFKDFSEVHGAGDGKVFVYGTVDKVEKVGVYKHDGKKIALVGEKDGDGDICNVNGIVPCSFGVCVYDANCRSLRVWSADGSNFVGAGDLNAFVGLTYIWPVALTMGKEAAWMTFTQEQTEKAPEGKDSMHYGFIARVTGLN